MMPKENEWLRDAMEHQERLSPQLITEKLPEKLSSFSLWHEPDLDALKVLDYEKPELLRPTLARLIEARAQHYEPVRFRFIEALTEKALQQRMPVAEILEKKALQSLSEYVNDYLPARKRIASLAERLVSEMPKAAEAIARLFDTGDLKGAERLAKHIGRKKKNQAGVLAGLTREMLQCNETDTFAVNSSFEDKLRQQELDVMQSITGVAGGKDYDTSNDQRRDGSGELSAMRYFRKSLVKRNSERRVTRAIQERPENLGPLNQQALIVRSLSIMQDLSPGYTTRFVSYMDTFLWLKQAGGVTAPVKSKGKQRRKS